MLLFYIMTRSQLAGAETFTAATFNIQKMDNYSWSDQVFQDFVNDHDFVFVQEAIKEALDVEGYEFNFFESWSNSTTSTGLATYSKLGSCDAQVLVSPTTEPITNTPKISVVERFELSSSKQRVMIVNTHGINFRGLSHFKKQMKEVFDHIKSHEGPLIWLGDFNTRSSSRTSYLRELTKKLNLNEVDFEKRSYWFLNLDRAFVRGVHVLEAYETRLDISDHEPLTIKFEL